MAIQDLLSEYDTLRMAYAQRVGACEAARDEHTRISHSLASHKELEDTYEKVSILFQTYSDLEHEQLRARVETLVTHGLVMLFGEGMSFKVTPGVERGQATMRFSILTGTLETDILESRGGGLASVVGFVLRLVMLILGPSKNRRFLLLDETFAWLSEDHQPRMGEFLRYLVDQTSTQIVLVTHQPAIAAKADLIYRFTHDGTKTVVAQLGTEDL